MRIVVNLLVTLKFVPSVSPARPAASWAFLCRKKERRVTKNRLPTLGCRLVSLPESLESYSLTLHTCTFTLYTCRMRKHARQANIAFRKCSPGASNSTVGTFAIGTGNVQLRLQLSQVYRIAARSASVAHAFGWPPKLALQNEPFVSPAWLMIMAVIKL